LPFFNNHALNINGREESNEDGKKEPLSPIDQKGLNSRLGRNPPKVFNISRSKLKLKGD
jgi:hypothetical protein